MKIGDFVREAGGDKMGIVLDIKTPIGFNRDVEVTVLWNEEDISDIKKRDLTELFKK
jgi:hypothetical protein